MKSYTILFWALGFTIPAFSFSSDTVIKYNWARTGLNIRIQNDIDSEIIGRIPYGKSIEIIPTHALKEYQLAVDALFKQGHNYLLEGYWVKVKYGVIEGFVFDGYLSHLPAIDFIEDEQGNEYANDLLTYLNNLYSVTDSLLKKDKNSDLMQLVIKYDQGALYEKNGNVGWYEEIIILPAASLNDGFLIFNILFNIPEIRNLQDHEKMTIENCDYNCLRFSSNTDGEKFELHQFGSNLIIRISNSC